MKDFNAKLSAFLDLSKTAYHAVSNVKLMLDAKGFTRLYENEDWSLAPKGKYYVVRQGSSIIAFVNNGGGFMIGAAHGDSPAFRVKGDASFGAYVKLETEKYGGMINYTWLDRPLTVAGRVTVKCDGGVDTRLADIGGKRVVIPSLAIHMNRNVNVGCKFNPAKELLPIVSLSGNSAEIFELAAKSVGASACDIVSHELYLVSAEKPVTFGLNDEMLLSPRLDDLSSVYAMLEGFLEGIDGASASTPVLAVFDNEEVGSQTLNGAASTFLFDTLKRISRNENEYLKAVASSFMVSADNAHAMHPNYPEMSDKSNAPVLGGGVAVKYNANKRYATDVVSDAVLCEISSRAGAKLQRYFNRADLPGGSTLGSIADTKVSVPTVDIGIPQLAMHSANECIALSDAAEMKKIFSAYFAASLSVKGESIKIK